MGSASVLPHPRAQGCVTGQSGLGHGGIEGVPSSSSSSFPAQRSIALLLTPTPRFHALEEKGGGISSRMPAIPSYYLCIFYLFTINCYKKAITAVSA